MDDDGGGGEYLYTYIRIKNNKNVYLKELQYNEKWEKNTRPHVYSSGTREKLEVS